MPETQSGESRGLRDQFGATRAAVMGLVRAHIELARSEFTEILDEVKRASVLVGIAIGLLLFVVMLVSVGSVLWFGEWVFGSMGWGVSLGTELFTGIAIGLVLMMLGRPGSRIVWLLVASAVIGIVVGVVLGLNLTNTLWARIGESVAPTIDPGYRPLAVGAVAGAVVLGVLFLVGFGARGGVGGAIGGLVSGAILGLLVGALTAITFSREVAAAIGATVALGIWPALLGLDIARAGVDGEALKARFWPTETIDTTKETIEWVREQTPLGRKS